MNGDYYEDLRFCASCKDYVRYLQSPEHAYCVECGKRVVVFSKADQQLLLIGCKREPTALERRLALD
jgi:DNA-directed RNA polymerase subunit RPC12/RpoP